MLDHARGRDHELTQDFGRISKFELGARHHQTRFAQGHETRDRLQRQRIVLYAAFLLVLLMGALAAGALWQREQADIIAAPFGPRALIGQANGLVGGGIISIPLSIPALIPAKTDFWISGKMNTAQTATVVVSLVGAMEKLG